MISAGEVHLPGRPEGHRRPQGARDRRRPRLRQRPAGRRQGPRRRPDPRARASRSTTSPSWPRRRQPDRRDRPRRRSRRAPQAAPMLAWARQHGMVSTFHTGGPSIAGSSAIRADVVLEARPDIVGHINGGTTALPDADIEQLVASGHGDRDRPLRQRPRGAARDRAGPRDRRPRPRDPRQRRAVGHRRRARSGSCARWPTSRPSAASRRRRPSAWRPATPRGSTGSTTGTIAVGREADIALVDAPQGSVGGHRARRPRHRRPARRRR